MSVNIERQRNSQSQIFQIKNKYQRKGSENNNFLQKSADLQKQRYLRTSKSYREKQSKYIEPNRPKTAIQIPNQQQKRSSQSAHNIRQKNKIPNQLQKLGLENFMKQIITQPSPSKTEISNKIIFALNKTYLANNVSLPTSQLVVKFRPKTSRNLINNEKKESEEGVNKSFDLNSKFSEMQFVNYQMFPKRKTYTKLLKAKHYGSFNAKKIQQVTQIGENLKNNRQKSFEEYLKKTAEKMLGNSSKRFYPSQRSKQKAIKKEIHGLDSKNHQSGIATRKAIIHY